MRRHAVRHRDGGGTLTKEVSYAYDALDRRIARDLDADGDGAVDDGGRFVYDGRHVLLEYDDDGSLENRHLHGPAVDQVFASEDALGEVLWALTDRRGTVRDVADHVAGSGGGTTVVNHLVHDAFGNVTGESDPSVEFAFGYTGRAWDPDAELYYYRARWYDPATGRFVGEDPLGFAGGDANLSRYVGNSPTNFTDPGGLYANAEEAGRALYLLAGHHGLLDERDEALETARAIDEVLAGLEQEEIEDLDLRQGSGGAAFLADVLREKIEQANEGGYASGGYWDLLDVIGGDAFAKTPRQPGDPPRDAVDQLDAYFAGFADVITLNGTTWLRERLYGEFATRNHHGTAFALGQGSGALWGLAAGYGAAGTAPQGARALLAHQTLRGYTAVETVGAMGQSGRVAGSGLTEGKEDPERGTVGKRSLKVPLENAPCDDGHTTTRNAPGLPFGPDPATPPQPDRQVAEVVMLTLISRFGEAGDGDGPVEFRFVTDNLLVARQSSGRVHNFYLFEVSES